MDPLTALGLASNVFSFVSFASGLIKGTIEISASVHGCTADITEIDSICYKLQSLCDGLESCSEHQIQRAGNDDDHVVKVLIAVKALCEVCKSDGEKLLQVVGKLRTKHGSNGKWNSFRIALKGAWEKTKVDELEGRLSRTQVTLTMHICTLAHYCSRAQSDRLERLQQRSLRLQSNQAEALTRISHGLVDLENRVRAAHLQYQQGSFTMSDVDRLQQNLESMSLSEQHVEKQQAVLQSLTFDSRPVRHAQIVKAHEKTFRWALETDQDQPRGSGIGDWLKYGEGIFWVSGKPGAGKSTLMKYIADSGITTRLISAWANPGRAVIASHYFWIAGTSMQKSQKGLLQALLYDIFRQCPRLIDQICVERSASSQPAVPWPLEELHEALQTVASRTHDCLKFCFIIDGMDEFSGDHEDRIQLCRTLKNLAKSESIKLLLSSRPWNVYEEEFGLHFPKIYMQDLTRGDIESFVTARLEEHTRWTAVSTTHSQGQWLISEITAKSNGVFLWVFLVTKLLREGLTNRDAFVDLRRRLQSFPTELEPFFKTMLEGVQPFYHSHMSTALQLACASTESQMSFLVYSFHFQEYEDPDYAMNQAIRFINEDKIKEMKSNTSWHLDSRTRGLLEFHPDGNVTLLHRTARDFLNTQEMHDFLVAKNDTLLNFHPVLSILKAHLALIKISRVPNQITRTAFGVFETPPDDSSDMLELLGSALKYAGQLESHAANDLRYRSLLDELDRSLLCLLSRPTCELVPRNQSNRKQSLLREQLVQLGLFEYLHSKLDSEPSFLENVGPLPVLHFLSRDLNNGASLQRGRGTDVLISLLESRGKAPSMRDESRGIDSWKKLLAHICHSWASNRKDATRNLSFLLEEGILQLFLKAGASVNTKIISPGPTFDSYRSRAASVVYVEFCFDILDQSPPIQALYLDLLKDFLRLSNSNTVKEICEEFCSTLGNRSNDELYWDLSFFSKVYGTIIRSLGGHETQTAEVQQSLDLLARRVFPRELFASTEDGIIMSQKGKRKQMAGSVDRKRKNQRQI